LDWLVLDFVGTLFLELRESHISLKIMVKRSGS